MWMSIALRNILYKIRVKLVDTEKIGIKTCEDTEREPKPPPTPNRMNHKPETSKLLNPGHPTAAEVTQGAQVPV